MALVKKSKIAAGAASPKPRTASVAEPKPVVHHRPAAPGASRHAKASERVAAATEELAAGLVEASAAAEELRRSMEQIAAGAEEAAGASQEQLAAIRTMVANLIAARNGADTSRRRTENLQLILSETVGQITASVRAIEKNAERQQASGQAIAEFERRAQEISEITRTVSRIADQTNLLALNAAIEAARAGDHGRGFAVVAEEVRALAEASDKSAQEVQALVETAQSQVRGVVQAAMAAAVSAANEARAGGAVINTLSMMRQDVARLADRSQEILTAAMEAERAASEAQRGAEQVASAAEEQSAAAAEAQSATQEQTQSLDQGRTAAQALAALAEQLRAGHADASSAEQVGASAEQLSATIQELSGAASQIMATIEQINRGSQIQASATQQTSVALAQIEQSAGLAQTNVGLANEQVRAMEAGLRQSHQVMSGLVDGVGKALDDTRSSLDMIGELNQFSRRIDKIVDSIALVAVQISMLAVSGAVEAARAGDAGRGFAVVSNNIRTLAREAAESADRIKDTVQAVIDQIASVRRDLEQIVGAAEIEIEKNRAMFSALDKIDGDVAALAGANDVILRGADAILAAATEIAVGARQIATAAEEAGSASRQAAIASNEQARGAEDLAAAIEEIASLAGELNRSHG